MFERRYNWKEELGTKARNSRKKKEELRAQLDIVLTELQKVGNNFNRYDELQKQKREILAKIASL